MATAEGFYFARRATVQPQTHSDLDSPDFYLYLVPSYRIIRLRPDRVGQKGVSYVGELFDFAFFSL
jgi:hypothetical protein